MGSALRRRARSGYSGRWCFFFQAEDGIRDLTVTGVQTCALPISPQVGGDARRELPKSQGLRHVVVGADLEADDHIDLVGPRAEQDDRQILALAQIGRASCRERV